MIFNAKSSTLLFFYLYIYFHIYITYCSLILALCCLFINLLLCGLNWFKLRIFIALLWTVLVRKFCNFYIVHRYDILEFVCYLGYAMRNLIQFLPCGSYIMIVIMKLGLEDKPGIMSKWSAQFIFENTKMIHDYNNYSILL